MKTLLRMALASALIVTSAPAFAGELQLSIADGRVTLVARDVTVREILAEWARVGKTRIVNGEKVLGGPVTLQLENVPEAQALDTLLRSAAGYIMAPRSTTASGPSVYDRIMILATSRAPAMTAPPPAAFRNVVPQPPVVIENEPDDNDEVDFAAPPQNVTPGMGVPVPGQTFPGQAPLAVPNGQPMPNGQPTTLSRPGMLPAPPAPQVPGASPNPFNNPGVLMPGPGVQPPPRPGGGGGGGL